MASSRLPGPLTRGMVSGLEQWTAMAYPPFANAYVVGYLNVRGSSRRRKRTPPSGHREITVAADFPNPWANDADEIQAIRDDLWFPSTDDFIALETNSRRGSSRASTPVTGSVESFIFHILDQPRGSIRRINIITHGNSSSIAFSGEIDKAGAVYFEEELDIGTLKSLLLHGMTYRGRHVEWQEVEDRFARDAEIVIYACKAALAESLLQDFADFFDVTVKGFEKELFYFHPLSTQATRLNRWHLTVDGQKDFHALVPTVVKKPELKDPF